MTANSSLDQLFQGPTPLPSEPVEEQRRVFDFSWEGAVTFALVLLAMLAVVASIEEANWVNEMPSLFAAAFVGLLSGSLLARVRLPAALLYAGGIALGLAVVFGETLHTMRLEDPLAGGGVRVRWDELWLRLEDWWLTLIDGGISNDALPFILLIVFSSWALSFMAAWSVFRWHNAWVALIPGGFALLTNISYLPGQPSFAFILYLFAAILLVTRMHVVRASERWREQRVVRPPLLSLEVLSYVTWLGLALILFAWLVPTANNWGPVAGVWRDALSPVTRRIDRVGRLFVGIDAKRGNLVHRYGDVLPLQGKVTLDEDVLLTVVAPEESEYLRAAVYDRYTGQGWRVSGVMPAPLIGTSVEAASFGTAATRAQVRRPVVVDVTLDESAATRRLFSVGDPLAADRDASVLTGGARADVLGLVPEQRVRRGDTYSTVGTVSAAAVDTLLGSGRSYPVWVTERYLQLPADLPPEIRTLTLETARGAEEPYIVARLVENLLRQEYPFDLQIEDPPPRADGVAYFLFESGRGYFDHHASAMVVMLRTVGIPARIAVGFALDPRDFDAETKAYAVSERRAWAWPEVYFGGLGWVEFNPTPTRQLIRRPGDDSEFLGAAAILGGLGLDEALLLGVDDELLEDDLLLGDRSLLLVEPEAGSTLGAAVAVTITAIVLVAIVGAVSVILVRAGWGYWFRGLPPASRRWAKLQLLAAGAGIATTANRTPVEAARDLRAAVALDVDVEALGRAYARERYGGRERGESEDEAERLDALYVAGRNRLLRRLLSRALPLPRSRSAVGERAGARGDLAQ